jgi:hypothetical protein
LFSSICAFANSSFVKTVGSSSPNNLACFILVGNSTLLHLKEKRAKFFNWPFAAWTFTMGALFIGVFSSKNFWNTHTHFPLFRLAVT